jgi:hypothetical protein
VRAIVAALWQNRLCITEIRSAFDGALAGDVEAPTPYLCITERWHVRLFQRQTSRPLIDMIAGLSGKTL